MPHYFRRALILAALRAAASDVRSLWSQWPFRAGAERSPALPRKALRFQNARYRPRDPRSLARLAFMLPHLVGISQGFVGWRPLPCLS